MTKANGLSHRREAYCFMHDYAVVCYWKSLLSKI